MRKKIAKLLVRLACRVDPALRSSIQPHEPLEFITTSEIAAEIRRRNDVAIVFWGRVQGETLAWECCSFLPNDSVRGILKIIRKAVDAC